MPIGLHKGKISFIILIITQCVRDLLEDNNNANTRQHPLNHRRRKIISDNAGFCKTKQHLYHTGDHNGQQKYLKCAKFLNG